MNWNIKKFTDKLILQVGVEQKNQTTQTFNKIQKKILGNPPMLADTARQNISDATFKIASGYQ